MPGGGHVLQCPAGSLPPEECRPASGGPGGGLAEDGVEAGCPNDGGRLRSDYHNGIGTGGLAPGAYSLETTALNVVIQGEFVRVWPQSDSLRLVLSLVIDKGFNQVFREHVPAQQECVIVG